MRPPENLRRTTAALHDGTRIDVAVRGAGPHLLLLERTDPLPAAEAESLRQWGGDPDYGHTLATGLADHRTVVTADLVSHRLAHPAPDTLTPANLVADVLAIADAAGADRFGYVGYSWLALAALQLAARSDRIAALAMGGFPPLDGPYREMLAVTRSAHAMAARSATDGGGPTAGAVPGDWDSAGIATDDAQTRQFVTLYEHLQDVDDRAIGATLTMPRLAFAGADDDIAYGADWGGVVVPVASTVRRTAAELETAGWSVRLLDGRDHMTAMHGDVVLPLVAEWLSEHQARPASRRRRP